LDPGTCKFYSFILFDQFSNRYKKRGEYTVVQLVHYLGVSGNLKKVVVIDEENHYRYAVGTLLLVNNQLHPFIIYYCTHPP
jgi:hypothetical protein